jgi:rare lipoprotein A (peptidoglycan hydrolase)
MASGMGDSAVGTLTRAVALVVVFGLAGCSAPGTRYSAGYAHHHRSYETARSTPSTHEHVADLGGGSRGMASFYSGRSATGERVGSNVLTAAHRTLPFGTKVRVTNLKNGQSVTVRINDRGPFLRNRSIDLSDGAAGAIGMKGAGVAPVRMEVIR